MPPLLVKWIEDAVLGTAWARVAGHLPEGAYVLIACLDSNRTPARSSFLMERARSHDPEALDHEGRIVMRAGALQPFVDDEQACAGFDEVWAFADRPHVVEPQRVGLTSETPIEPSDELEAWFAETGCLLGIGDGYGVNYATPSRALAEALERV